MHIRTIYNKKTHKGLLSFNETEIERVNPIKYHRDLFVIKQLLYDGISISEINGETKPAAESKEILNKALNLWEKRLLEITQLKIPNPLITLLSSVKKSDQEQLLKRIILTPDILLTLIFRAYAEHNYTFSQYKAEFPQKGVDLSKMPITYEVNETSINVFSKTKLSEGQLKQFIQHRKVIVSIFLDKEEDWHCFFTTYNNLDGGETWLGVKQPHFHYISSRFGITREKAINELKSEKYSLGNLPHIKLLDYGKQPEEK